MLGSSPVQELNLFHPSVGVGVELFDMCLKGSGLLIASSWECGGEKDTGRKQDIFSLLSLWIDVFVWSAGDPHSDCPADEGQELCGEEPGSGRNPGKHLCHLHRQDRDPDPKQDDSR